MDSMLRLGEVFLGPFLDPGSRTYWGGLALAGLVGLGLGVRRGAPVLRRTIRDLSHPSSLLDLQLLLGRQLLLALGVLPVLGSGWWLATHLVRWLDAVVGVPRLAWPAAGVTVVYTLALFVAWDASRYLLHRLMHAWPPLWALHQVHHSAQVLTPLTFHRIHPLESVLYGLRGALVTGLVTGLFFWLFRGAATEWTLLGVHGLGLIFNVATGNLRHSHVWLGFGALEALWISPAQHQLHHAPDGERTNYGTWLSVWDHLGGTLQRSGPVPPVRFGLEERNHGDSLLSAWLGPLVPAGWRGSPGWRRGLATVLALGLSPGLARAQDEPQAPGDVQEPAQTQAQDDDQAEIQIIVTASDGTPRVAGSAHVVGEEELERFEHNDIHAVLQAVPGVSVRGEDGFGLRPNIGIRGVNADRSAKITLLEDGILLAPAPYSAPAAYYFPMVTRVVAVEVFKGPASIQHGPHTVGGAVNLVTHAVPFLPPAQPGIAQPSPTVALVDLGVGSFQTGKLHARLGTGGERWGLLAEGVGLHTAGFKHLDGGGPTGFDRGEVMLKTAIRTDPTLRQRTGLELKLGYGHETSRETYLGLHPDDYAIDPYRRYAASQAGLMTWDRTQIELAWPLRLGDVDLRTVAYRHDLVRVWTKFNRFADGPSVHDLLQQPPAGQSEVFLAILRGDEDSTTEEQTLQIGTNDRRFSAWGVQSRARWSVPTAGGVESHLEVGLRLHGDRVDRLHTEDPHQMRSGQLVAEPDAETLVLTDSRASSLALAAHVHEDLVLDWLHLVPGLRVESIAGQRDDSDVGTVRRTIALPGMGLLAELGPSWSVFTGAHRGFSPVPPGEAPEVRPESSWNLEAGLRAGGSGSHGELVGYLNDYVNLTGQCTISGGCLGDDLDRQFNGGKVWVYGVEAVLGHELLLPRKLSVPLEATYTYSQGQFRTGFVSGFPQFGTVEIGDFLPYLPRHQGSLAISLLHPSAGLSASLHGRSGMLDQAGPMPVPDDTGVPALITLDLAADVQLSGGTSLYATATNVTGASQLVSWRPFGARPPAPLQLTLGVKVEQR